MPALKKTDISGTIVWLGRVPHRDADEIETDGLTEMTLTFAGLEGEVHAGLTRPSCSRVSTQYPRGTEIRNVRQLSVVSEEELDRIAASLGLPQIDPRWLGASVVIRGIPDFSHVPPSSRLQAEGGCTLTVDMQNRPCHLPAMTIEAVAEGHGKGFKQAAKGLRGVTAWVEREGILRLGHTVTLHVPDQRAWAP
ncbi:MOSC domain-containing protein [Ponticoccus sp. SC2-23]|uniref:MOSC domain-containing protein n=1 Tax=Alexandriicola marinus TaxID=2081710 RepID=UPI000FD6BED8|nr:MOSC domain-containing protein [Alexandriicola marinus]MBM1221541.1 MOSC domain-containing protein [Ponticoccus sp. SC6-9]MBM1226582.1 MOSC domain-containing protein [Ponticoccus sp. SC6-15]MBM1230533.1 MOSC domain-containing protein [Ponticoccus sp. SC6-38]MBM1235056.1 MOSC domain-containing protein [Ponticoccus sp. SC6-45]MBM1239554.1 MOSC domain-containing protein [Ponticoccus sp. SC6-49]MBM1243336.1 MOSC domain-containing protein [Ponticoccus sp. SC2-64]MBM1248580.1 MOSC domain-contai